MVALMRTTPRVHTLLLPLLLALGACGEKAETTVTGGGSSGGDTEGVSTTSDSGATEVGGGATDSATDDPMTTANSVTTPPMTGDPSSAPTSVSESGESVSATTTSASGPTSDPSGDPSTTTTTANPTGETGGADEAATQLCVDTINMYRGTLGLPPLARWTDAEDCSDAECLSDGNSNTPHGAFGMCGEFAQNECPGWPGPPEDMITDCLASMWAEGPGDDFNTHGHYINMSSTDYTMVACGFAEVNGEIWAVQNFK
jgi:hypothetical protein